MDSVVIYDTRTGNTRRIAEAIAGELRARGSVRVVAADEADGRVADADLVVVGGPTERHGATEPITRFFERIGSDGLRGTLAAGFDTRLRWPHWLSGSAAERIGRGLRETGARVIAPEESFLVTMQPRLRAGELERAAAWGRSLAEAAAGAGAGAAPA